MKTKKSIIIAQISGFSILRCLLLLYYLYLNKNHDIGFWRLLLGGIGVMQSKYILDVVIWFFPDFLINHFVCSKYIRQLKENYVYIFVRERNMKRWLRKFVGISFLNILLYEIATVAILFPIGIVLQKNLVTQPGEFVVLVLCHFVKLAIITIFCDLLFLKFNEMVSVYANLLVQTLPLFLTGVLYDIDGAWDAAVKYIPVNWCNYNYLMELEMNPLVMLCLSLVLGVVTYLCLEKLFSNCQVIT